MRMFRLSESSPILLGSTLAVCGEAGKPAEISILF